MFITFPKSGSWTLQKLAAGLTVATGKSPGWPMTNRFVFFAGPEPTKQDPLSQRTGIDISGFTGEYWHEIYWNDEVYPGLLAILGAWLNLL